MLRIIVVTMLRKEHAMPALIIEHLKASELPQEWARRLKAKPEQTVTVHIETEREQTQSSETFMTDDPAFGIWRDREEADHGPRLRVDLRVDRWRMMT